MFDTMFSKTYELPLAKGYVRHWGVLEAVRELIQNAIDSDSPFEWEFNNNSLTITSKYSHLTTSSLLLGATTKAEDDEKIGSFGEGYKIALLVLTREGYDVHIENNDKDWKPAFKYSKVFEDEVLSIESTIGERGRKGLKFVVHGLSSKDISAIKATCLQMQDPDQDVLTTSYGEILPSRPGKLYVNGLFVCETKLEYGYNMKPNILKLERDRQTVDGFDLKFTTVNMWYQTNQYDKVAQMIDSKVPDVVYAEYNQTELIKEACYKLFRENHPQGVVASSQQEMENLVRNGMTTVIISPAASLIRASSSYKAENHVPVKTPNEVLKEWLRKNRSEMRGKAIEAFKKELLVNSTKWKN